MSNNHNNYIPQTVIFIHSLFRSGSTYFFNVFRRANTGYWCYQEPLHEMIFLSKDVNNTFLNIHDKVAKQLRHPLLDKPYYQELCEIRESWKEILLKESIYDHYFVTSDEDKSIPYFKVLIKAAKGIPVIQECRTSSRIGNLKNTLAGIHLYLWRNPWDQWWSYQINDYFNAINMLIINAKQHPKEIAIFRDKIQFTYFESADIYEQVVHFKSIPVNSGISYQAFYLLWCLGLREALKHADLMVNIDKLSYDMEYRFSILKKFYSLGLHKCDFADCVIPQAFYTPKDK
ncbi:MAG: hypothetical protein JO131_03075, partial [Gammaproteobacteria bacterium]|nr:hypothetical protein [Gammaproteobacteria bacterium]